MLSDVWTYKHCTRLPWWERRVTYGTTKAQLKRFKKRTGQNCSLASNSIPYIWKLKEAVRKQELWPARSKRTSITRRPGRPTPGSTRSLRRQLSLYLRANGMEQWTNRVISAWFSKAFQASCMFQIIFKFYHTSLHRWIFGFLLQHSKCCSLYRNQVYPNFISKVFFSLDFWIWKIKYILHISLSPRHKMFFLSLN